MVCQLPSWYASHTILLLVPYPEVCPQYSSYQSKVIWYCIYIHISHFLLTFVAASVSGGKFMTDARTLANNSVLGQHCWISQNGCHVGSTRIQGWVRWDWWGDHDQIWSGTVRGWLVEIGASHQIWWNILREHNWGVPSAHIVFIYYVTYILECLIVLQGRAHTGMYTIL